MSTPRTPVVVLGAGPAGLGAALKLARRGTFDVTVLERQSKVGGCAGSFDLDGLAVDFGSHRLHPSCSPDVFADIRSLLGADLLDRPRHGRIRLRGRWLHFPLKPANLAVQAPPGFLFGVLRDALLKPFRRREQEHFAAVLEGGLGPTICKEFYFPYAEKIWGLLPTELDAEQARRRVSAGSISKLIRKVLNAVPGLKPKGAGRFFYPRGGYGQISEAYQRAASEAGANVKLATSVAGIDVVNGRAVAVTAENGTGPIHIPAGLVLSTIPLTALVQAIRPSAPPEVLTAARAMKFRAMILIYLVLETERFTEYDAHYFPEAGIPITRLSEPKNYGLAQVPGTTVLCAELPCATDDAVWKAGDEELRAIVEKSLATAGLPIRSPVRRVVSRRLSHAYPIYTRAYQQDFECLDAYVSSIEGLVTLGRQGLFAHDNTHHTLAMAYAASACLSSTGALDRERWADYRRQFEAHVVED